MTRALWPDYLVFLSLMRLVAGALEGLYDSVRG
jgi:hypothetical protein